MIDCTLLHVHFYIGLLLKQIYKINKIDINIYVLGYIFKQSCTINY